MGMGKREIDRKFDDIVEFSGIGEFMDSPVKHYSSGMYVRLGFAIAAHMEPDILIIDEVLAVGDFAFRQKCFGRINEIRKSAAVVLVSHSMRDITMLCSGAIVMHRGRLIFYGPAQEAVNFYMNMIETDIEKKSDAQATMARLKSGIYGELCHNTEKIRDVDLKWADVGGNELTHLDHGTDLYLNFSFMLLISEE